MLPTAFDENVIPLPDLPGCWLWVGSTNGRYGTFRRRYVHRRRWEQFSGAIPAGLFVCHRCDVPLCVNPTHLFLGTPRENMQDAINKGRLTGRPTVRAIRCPQGHSMTPENTYVYPPSAHRSRHVQCRECNRIKCRARYHAA